MESGCIQKLYYLKHRLFFTAPKPALTCLNRKRKAKLRVKFLNRPSPSGLPMLENLPFFELVKEIESLVSWQLSNAI